MDTTLHPYIALDEHLKNGPERIVASGNGIYITDTQGRTYIDAMASLICVNVGYGRSEVAAREVALVELGAHQCCIGEIASVNGGAKRDHRGGVRRDHLAAAGLSP